MAALGDSNVLSRYQRQMSVFLTSKLLKMFQKLLYYFYLFISEWHCDDPLNVLIIIGPKVSGHTMISLPDKFVDSWVSNSH